MKTRKERPTRRMGQVPGELLIHAVLVPGCLVYRRPGLPPQRATSVQAMCTCILRLSASSTWSPVPPQPPAGAANHLVKSDVSDISHWFRGGGGTGSGGLHFSCRLCHVPTASPSLCRRSTPDADGAGIDGRFRRDLTPTDQPEGSISHSAYEHGWTACHVGFPLTPGG